MDINNYKKNKTMEKKITITLTDTHIHYDAEGLSFVEQQGLLDFFKRKNFIDKMKKVSVDEKIEAAKKWSEGFEKAGKVQEFTATYEMPSWTKATPKKKAPVKKKKK